MRDINTSREIWKGFLEGVQIIIVENLLVECYSEKLDSCMCEGKCERNDVLYVNYVIIYLLIGKPIWINEIKFNVMF